MRLARSIAPLLVLCLSLSGVAAKKDKLTEYISLVTEAGLNPLVVDVDAFTIENMYGTNYDSPEGEVAALVNIGASVMNINILKDGISAFTRDISVGGNRYTEAIQKELSLDFQDGEQAKMIENPPDVNMETLKGIMDSINNEVAGEVTRSLDYFRTTSGQENIDRVLLSGGAAKTKGLLPLLSERLGVQVEMANPFSRVEVDNKLFDPDLMAALAPQAAVGVGLAIRKMGDR